MEKLVTKKINNQKVHPIVVQKGEGKFRGTELFPEWYGNIFALGRKKSGKTSVIFKILKECVGKQTTVIIFCGTVNKDASYLVIQDWLRRKGIACIVRTSLDDLGELMDHLKGADKSDSDDSEEDEKKVRKPRVGAPEYVFIIDDLSEEGRVKTLTELLKTNRHHKSKTIISSQHVMDIMKSARKQIDYWLLFPKLSEEILETVHKDAGLGIPFAAFKLMYETVTQKPHQFLYVGATEGDFRHNFDVRIIPQ